MSVFNVLAILITISAILSFINYRTLKLPTTIGIMLIALVISIITIFVDAYIISIRTEIKAFLYSIDFNKTLMQGMLSYLLFAGALHVNLSDLNNQKRIIALLSTLGIIISTFLVGFLTWGVSYLLNLNLDFIYCLLFGALISPTDPIAVIGIMKKVGAPKDLETKVAGESLFNDGVGVVVFLAILNIATSTNDVAVSEIAVLFAQEAVGGAVFGLLIGMIAYWMLRQVDNYSVEVLITLALVSGGYALALALHLSGPIAVVIAGLIIGNHGRKFAMSDTTRLHLDTFWELIDEILNAVLFVMIGFEILVLSLTGQYLIAGALAIPLVLFARLVAVSAPVYLLKPFRKFPPKTIRILTWGGLRGGISVALALSLPKFGSTEIREVILTMTYAVVVFSILVQGLTIGRLIRSSSDQTGTDKEGASKD